MQLRKITNPSFNRVMNKIVNSELDVKICWRLNKVIRKLSIEQKQYTETQQKLLNKYGMKDEDKKLVTDKNGNVEFDEGKQQEFTLEIDKVLDIEIEVVKIKLDDLDGIKLTVLELTLVEDLIEES